LRLFSVEDSHQEVDVVQLQELINYIRVTLMNL